MKLDFNGDFLTRCLLWMKMLMFDECLVYLQPCRLFLFSVLQMNLWDKLDCCGFKLEGRKDCLSADNHTQEQVSTLISDSTTQQAP